MQAAELRLIQSQHRFVFKNDRALSQTKVSTVAVGAEGDFARRKLGKTLDGVHDRDVVRCLIFKEP